MANSLTVTGGGMQGAFVSEMFALPVTILVKNASNVPQVGVAVTSAVPGSGASCTTAASANTDGSGVATFYLTANGTAGQYAVDWTSAGANTVGALFRNSTLVTTSQTKSPTLCTQEVITGGGTLGWSNPGFIIATGTTNYAEVVMGFSNTAGSQLLKGSQFGFTIPTNAHVRGLEFTMQYGRVSGSNSAGQNVVNFVGAQDFTSPRSPGSASAAWRTLGTAGSSTDIWGGITVVDPSTYFSFINDPTFSVGYYLGNTTSVTYRSNEWALKVYYSTAPALPVSDTAAALNFCAN